MVSFLTLFNINIQKIISNFANKLQVKNKKKNHFVFQYQFMKRSLKLLLFCMCFVIGTQMALSSSGNNYTSRVTVKVDPTNLDAGSVAVKHAKTTVSGIASKSYSHTKDGGDPTYPDDYGIEKSDEYTTAGGTNRAEHCFYIYAHANVGYEFDHWDGGPANNSVNNNTNEEYAFTFDNSTSSGTLPYTIIAYFRKIGIIDRETNNNAGYIQLSKDDAKAGEEITATAILYEVGNGNFNMMSYFSHWEDGDGNWLSDDIEYTFEAKPMTLRAVFGTKGAKPEVGKYYRVRNAYNRVLTIAGNYSWTPTINNADVPTTILRWALPLDYDETKFNTGQSWEVSDNFNPVDPESTPGTIIFIESGTNNSEGLTGGVMVSQGLNTKETTGATLDIVPVFDYFYGYYAITSSWSSVGSVAFKAIPRNNEGIINLTSPALSSPVCAMAIQPIDEDHVDDFWFGAYAERSMYYDGGYWTSMYTAFPYKLYDDGVRAFYVTSTTESNGKQYACLKEFEDRIVPANTAVLLKCEVPENTKANRMIPLSPADVQKVAPADNLISGVFQLYESEPGTRNYVDTRLYNSPNIRVLGVNSAGEVGFFKMSGADSMLKANKAYMDTAKLPAEISTLSFRLGSVEDATTGIESVVVDSTDNDEIYDIMGRKVATPTVGNLYIVNGKKIIWK